MEDTLFIGQVTEVKPSGTKQVALLKPYYAMNSDTNKWVALDNHFTRFPNRGLVNWLAPLADAVKDSIWAFSCDVHPDFDDQDRWRDKYRINWDHLPEPVYDVIDLGLNNSLKILERMISGVKLKFTPTKLVYIVIDYNSWAGPVKIVKKDPSQKENIWTLDPGQVQPVKQVKPLSKDKVIQITHINQSRSIILHDEVLEKIGDLDWSDDESFIRKFLKMAVEQSQADMPILTKSHIRHAAEHLKKLNTSVSEQQIQRALSIVNRADYIEHNIERFLEDFLFLPAIEKRIQSAEEEARQKALAEIQDQLNHLRQDRDGLQDEIDNRKKDLANLRKIAEEEERRAQTAADRELQRRSDELKALDAQIASRQQKLDEQVEQIEQSISARLSELLARPADTIAQVALLRAAFGMAVPAQASAPSSVAPALGQRHITPPQHITVSARKPLDSQKLLQSKRIASLHSTLLAGLVPVLVGPNAQEILEHYTYAVAGGRCIWVNIAPSMLEPSDILGRIDQRSGYFIPHASRLLDTLIFAQQPDQQENLFVVVFDGINRAAVDAYLAPVLACYRSRYNSNVLQHRHLPVAHPSAFRSDDPYAVAASITWPQNVLLTGTVSDGPAILPIPTSFWPDLFYIDAIGETSLDAQRGEVSFVTYQQWSLWHNTPSGASDSPLKKFCEDTDLSVPRRLNQVLETIYQHFPNQPQALADVVKGGLLPYMIGTQQTESLLQILVEKNIDIKQDYVEFLERMLL